MTVGDVRHWVVLTAFVLLAIGGFNCRKASVGVPIFMAGFILALIQFVGMFE